MPNNYKIDVMSYQRSISKELIALKDRVRSLIGNRHWGEEGRYKEIILMNFLRKHLPMNMAVGTGFVMNENDYSKLSSQIDLIIYDDTYPVIFKENDFVILHARSVLGIIEVKSKFDKYKFNEVVLAAANNFKLIKYNRKVFNGIFYFDCGDVEYFRNSNVDSTIKNTLKNLNGDVDYICFGENVFLKYWSNSPSEYRFYEIKELSFSYFISNLIETAYKLCNNFTSGNLELIKWFLYPIEETKEAHLIDKIKMRLSPLEEEFNTRTKLES